MNSNCAFCEQAIDQQEVIRTEFAKVIYPRRPVIEAAVMIMPIRHYEALGKLKRNELSEIFLLVDWIRKSFRDLYACESYNLFLNEGIAAGQHVPHIHFHLFGRSQTESINPLSILNNKESYQKIERLEPAEIRKRAEKIRLAIQTD